MGSSSVASEESITQTIPPAAADGGGGHGGGGKHHHHHFQIHFPHLDLFGGGAAKKGRVAVMVGEEGEEQQRFVVPVIYINHPLFLRLLKSAEEEFDFHYHKGPITIPCHVEEFRNIQGLIDRETNNNLHHHHGHHHHHSQLSCFRV
ncbi:unnamed protein product [Linum trigynum]|uniref:Auxin-responsive protein SAUR32 n=1 Tax=Linum trigynum TaxID=586398 RepID=A0AAV2D3I8_9ROSI